MPAPATSAVAVMGSTRLVEAPRSLAPHANKITARVRRTRLPGDLEDTRAPTQTPGMAPTRMLPVSPRAKSPKKRWPSDAEATSGTA